MNWQFVFTVLKITSYFLLFIGYAATTLLVCGWLDDNRNMVRRLFVLNLCTVTTLVVVHFGEHLLGKLPISDVPVWLAIAFHSMLLVGVLGLLAKVCSIFKSSKKNSAQNLKLARKKLKTEQRVQQATITALQDSEDRFQSIFNYAAMGIVIIDQQGKILEANRAYKDIGVHDFEMAQANSLMDNTHSDDLAKDRRAIAQLFDNKSPCYSYNKRYLHPDGSILWTDLRMSLVEPETSGAEPYAIAMLENITKRKEMEKELVLTQERLQELLQARTDQIVQMHEELSWQTNHDFLTGLLNRYAFERHLSKTLAALRHKRSVGSEHTLCYLNLDRFKAINELGGSLAGDAVLRQVSHIIESRCRQSDYIARLGADEFALLLHQCSLEQAGKVAISIVERIQEGRFRWQNREYSTSASIGLVPINESSGDASEMMIAADAACYAAKRRGRSRIHIYESDDQELVKFRSEAQWISKIEAALKNDRFRLYVQPIIPMNPEAEPPHCEVLVRLLSDDGEVISPGLFLPAAERYHLVTKIDCWVIEATLRHLAANLTERTKSHIYSINLSGASINDESLVGFIQRQFERYPIPTQMICFEVTETVAIANLNRANEVIQSIRAMGCRIALDDFGTGMSSFSYLKYLPVDYLKIDGSFIKDIVDDPIDFAMVETMNRIGHVMGVKTVAEYVSNEAILAKIKHIGIDYGQGFGLAMPEPLTPGYSL